MDNNYIVILFKSCRKVKLCNSLESPDELLVLLEERVERISLHYVLQVLLIVLRNNHGLLEVNLAGEDERCIAILAKYHPAHDAMYM